MASISTYWPSARQASLVLACTHSKPLSASVNLHWVHMLHNKKPTTVPVSRDKKAPSQLINDYLVM